MGTIEHKYSTYALVGIIALIIIIGVSEALDGYGTAGYIPVFTSGGVLNSSWIYSNGNSTNFTSYTNRTNITYLWIDYNPTLQYFVDFCAKSSLQSTQCGGILRMRSNMMINNDAAILVKSNSDMGFGSMNTATPSLSFFSFFTSVANYSSNTSGIFQFGDSGSRYNTPTLANRMTNPTIRIWGNGSVTAQQTFIQFYYNTTGQSGTIQLFNGTLKLDAPVTNISSTNTNVLGNLTLPNIKKIDNTTACTVGDALKWDTGGKIYCG